jgi:hypothetical protein
MYVTTEETASHAGSDTPSGGRKIAAKPSASTGRASRMARR